MNGEPTALVHVPGASASSDAQAHVRRRVLGLCARALPHEGQRAALRASVAELTSWEGMLELAEAHGVSPLVHAHLQDAAIAWPDEVRRGFAGLKLRHKKSNALRAAVMREVTDALRAVDIEPLWLKGAALAHLVYAEPAQRPMRDLDLVVPEREAERAQRALLGRGFHQDETSARVTPATHHHLPGLSRTIAGLAVQLEVHRAVRVRHDTMLLRYEDFFERAQLFEVSGGDARTLSREDMLWFVYRHGFCMPLAWEPYRLVWVADLGSAVERWIDEVDFARLFARHPELERALAMLHWITPHPPHVLERLRLPVTRAPARIGEAFGGAPLVPFRTLRGQHGLGHALRETWWPSEWWLRVHYGVAPGVLGLLGGRLRHVVEVLQRLWPR